MNSNRLFTSSTRTWWKNLIRPNSLNFSLICKKITFLMRSLNSILINRSDKCKQRIRKLMQLRYFSKMCPVKFNERSTLHLRKFSLKCKQINQVWVSEVWWAKKMAVRQTLKNCLIGKWTWKMLRNVLITKPIRNNWI